MKRALDIVFLIFISPIAIPSILIFYFLGIFFQGKPVFFFQSRGGYKNKKISIIKFRSMKNLKKKKYNTEITNYGKFIRLLKIDELPQLYNVLIGDMTLVGPRPLHYEYKKFFNHKQKKRFNVVPGLTGLSQLITSNSTSWKKKFELDVWYVKYNNIILDLLIIILTLFKIFLSILSLNLKNEKITKFNGKN